jgi:hypothetical protein
MNLTTGMLVAFSAIGLGILVVMLAYFRNIRHALPLIAAMLFFSSLGVQVYTSTQTRNYTWIAPIQDYRSHITAVIAGALLLGVFVHLRRLSAARWSPQGVVYLVMVVYAGFLMMAQISVPAGLATIALGFLTLLPLLIVVPNLLEDWEDCERAFRSMIYMMLVWGAVTLVQAFIDSEQLFGSAGARQGYRFAGLTISPQSAALLLSVTGTVGIWLIVNGRRGFVRLVTIGVTGSILVMLLWTASRTGAALFLIMVSFVLYSRLGRAALILPVLGVVTYGLWYYATARLDVDVGLSHLASTENTRAGAWGAMWQVGLKNFLFGAGIEENPFTENSLLYGFAAYGIGMLVLMLVFYGVSIVQIVHLVRARRLLDPWQKRVADMVLAFQVAYLAGALFEGYLLGRVSFMTVLLFTFGGMSTKIIDYARGLATAEAVPAGAPDSQPHPA